MGGHAWRRLQPSSGGAGSASPCSLHSASVVLPRLCTAQGSPAKAPQRPTPPDLAARMRPPPRQARLLGFIAAAVLLAGAHAASWRQGTGAGAAAQTPRLCVRPCSAPSPLPDSSLPDSSLPLLRSCGGRAGHAVAVQRRPLRRPQRLVCRLRGGRPLGRRRLLLRGRLRNESALHDLLHVHGAHRPLAGGRAPGRAPAHLPPPHPPSASFPASHLPRTLTRATR